MADREREYERRRDHARERDRDRRTRRERYSSHGDGDDDEPLDRPKSRESDRERERPRSRDGDWERERPRSRDGDWERERPRSRESDRERERPRSRESDWEREREYERPRERAPVLSFSRPATYDPRLAQRAHQQERERRRADDDDDDWRRRKQQQLKDELGLSDEDAGSDQLEDDEANGGRGGRGGGGGGGGGEGRAVERLQRELAAAREGERRAHESLSKLQLLSKSQTAILKTSMQRKLQARDAAVRELAGVVRDLERQLRAAGVAVREFSVEEVEEGDAGAGDAAPEVGAMQAELERLMDENKTLREEKTRAAAAVVVDVAAAERSAELDKLQAEKQQLARQLKEAQLQRAAPVERDGDAVREAVARLEDEKKVLAARLKEAQQHAAKASAAAAEAKAETKAAEAKAAAAAAAAAAADASKPPPAPTADNREALQQLQKQLAESEAQRQAATEQVSRLETQLAEAQAAQAAREKAWEEKHAKLKAAAESELAKIKEQAKKAILDLKRKLEAGGRAERDKRRAVAAASELARGQKAELSALKAALAALARQQLPAMAAQVSAQLSARLQQQSAAMAGVVDNYKRELRERKRLFNLVQELKGNIRVLCRVRPVSKSELANGSRVACRFPSPEEISLAGDKGKSKTWEFDRVFGPDATQPQLFAEVQPLVTSILDGYSVCIFAYGQTGSGKTFTMAGPPEDPGINTRSLQELFARKAARAAEYQDELTVSVLEIYNEQIRDLLAADAASTNLQVRQGPSGNFVPGLTLVPVQSLDEVFELIKRGNKNRSTHATDMNEHSSRSHSILSIQLRSTNIVAGSVASGRLFLVDLAGSERLSKTGAEGQRLKEAQSINKSLSALGDVIAARASRAKHVPYRNSALTYLLQDALGGDSKTLMVACASPVDYNSEESFCTLNFAARARSVEMGKATKNVTQAPVKE